MGKAAYVGSLNHEVLRQFPRNAEIHYMGVGGMHFAVQSPRDGKTAIVQVGGRDGGEGAARSWRQNITRRSGATLCCHDGNRINCRLSEPRAAIYALRGRGIIYQRG